MRIRSGHLGQRLLQIAGLTFFVAFVSLRYGMEPVQAARVSDIRGTKHNLSAAADGSGYTNPTAGAGTVPTRNIKATSETQICVFCHTPHGAATGATPLWNRKLAGNGYTQSYVLYDSNTLDAKQVQGSLDQPGGSSKLCLSCHDGTVAVGNVNVLNGISPTPNPQGTSTIATSGGTTMPTGAGATTGFTRNLGTDLSNDHPISVSYNDTLANRDGELRSPSANPTLVGVRTSAVKPKLKLENTGTPGANQAQVQCATCHDPHLRETDTSVGNQKFLRLNRFQQRAYTAAPTAYDPTDNTGDIICLACHDKAGASWTFSAHAHDQVADETYTAAAATQREFPATLPVWKAACLNCHDTHTVQGSRRLLREGTDSVGTPKAGGNPALEQTCYQCHVTAAASAVTVVTGGPPDIKTDFTTLTKKMPLTVGSPEVHDPSSMSTTIVNAVGFNLDCTTAGSRCGKDLIEPRVNLGVGALANRHAECTDCHNPHRVIRARNGLPGALNSANTQDTRQNGASGGAHDHRNATGYTHTNVISGVLRGSWGVEPTYGSRSFHALPTGYDIKRGDPANGSATDAGQTYVTREYQICMKCHSDYGYSDNNSHSSLTGNRPLVGAAGTTSGTNGLTMYTNQAKEFQAPASHASEPLSLGTDGGCVDANCNGNNHRSWHPVMSATGRTLAKRQITSTSPWRSPWNNTNADGVQTMYCTDCHGSGTGSQTVIPTGTNPWGPHGSDNNFILKGTWTYQTGKSSIETDSASATGLCFKCHDYNVYAAGKTNDNQGCNGSGKPKRTGFSTGSSGRGDLHCYHNEKFSKNLQCTWCHIAVPHGWKNKALLVNLNDVGEEAGQGDGSSKEVAINGNGSYYSKEPYYLFAKLKVSTFAASGSWSDGNCGSRGKTGGNLITSADGASSGNTTGTGVNWMKSTCSSPTN